MRSQASITGAKFVNQALSNAYQRKDPRMTYKPYAELRDAAGNVVAVHRNFLSNMIIACFLRRKRLTLEEGRAFLEYLKQLHALYRAWDGKSAEPDLFSLPLTLSAADVSTFIPTPPLYHSINSVPV
jgi:hypothetical protein